ERSLPMFPRSLAAPSSAHLSPRLTARFTQVPVRLRFSIHGPRLEGRGVSGRRSRRTPWPISGPGALSAPLLSHDLRSRPGSARTVIAPYGSDVERNCLYQTTGPVGHWS